MKSTKSIFFAVLFAGATFGWSCNSDNTNDEVEDTSENTVGVQEDVNEAKVRAQAEKDSERITELYAGSVYEVELSEMVQAKTKNAEVKSLAEMMAEAHRKMNGDLQSLVTGKGITLTGTLPEDKKESITDMSDNKNLDEDYLDKIIEKHKDAINKAEQLAEESNDADVRAYFGKAVGELKSHLEMAEALEDKIDGKN